MMFLVGLIVGTWLGFLTAALCVMAAETERKENTNDNDTD
jgi:hypothetical protein